MTNTVSKETEKAGPSDAADGIVKVGGRRGQQLGSSSVATRSPPGLSRAAPRHITKRKENAGAHLHALQLCFQ